MYKQKNREHIIFFKFDTTTCSHYVRWGHISVLISCHINRYNHLVATFGDIYATLVRIDLACDLHGHLQAGRSNKSWVRMFEDALPTSF